MKEEEKKEKTVQNLSEESAKDTRDSESTVVEQTADKPESIEKEVEESEEIESTTDPIEVKSKKAKEKDGAVTKEAAEKSDSVKSDSVDEVIDAKEDKNVEVKEVTDKAESIKKEVEESKQKDSTYNPGKTDSTQAKDENEVVVEEATEKSESVADASVDVVEDIKKEEKNPVPDSANFLIGRKIGMTRIFDDSGDNHPVTIINVNPNIVTQLKTNETDGYSAIQMGMDEKKKKNNYNKADKGKFDKLGLEYKNNLKEFRISDHDVNDFSVGLVLSVDVFKDGDKVNVTGITRGKGFTGHMKRHGFHGGRRSHGKNSVMRKAGAIGASADPARVWPGKKMAGRSGGNDNTVSNLTIVRVDSENNNLYVKGAISGAKNGIVYVEG